MNIRNAERKKTRIKLAIQSPSGGGKTYSSILLAKGIVSDLSKVILIDTENGSADLYAHLGNFKVLPLQAPFTPEKYIEAIELCEKSGAQCIIIDSLSHAWEFLLDVHSRLLGNSFTNWSKITPRQKAMVNKILTSPVHIIVTMRTKQDYVLNQRDGRYIPEKVGLKAIQRDGIDYEFTIVFNLDINHRCTASKDRTGLFQGIPEFTIDETIGVKIIHWCNQGVSVDTVKQLIQDCQSLTELTEVYKKYTMYYSALEKEFADQKQKLQNTPIINLKTAQNGTANHK